MALGNGLVVGMGIGTGRTHVDEGLPHGAVAEIIEILVACAERRHGLVITVDYSIIDVDVDSDVRAEQAVV